MYIPIYGKFESEKMQKMYTMCKTYAKHPKYIVLNIVINV